LFLGRGWSNMQVQGTGVTPKHVHGYDLVKSHLHPNRASKGEASHGSNGDISRLLKTKKLKLDARRVRQPRIMIRSRRTAGSSELESRHVDEVMQAMQMQQQQPWLIQPRYRCAGCGLALSPSCGRACWCCHLVAHLVPESWRSTGNG
jgi:hypothetical protein